MYIVYIVYNFQSVYKYLRHICISMHTLSLSHTHTHPKALEEKALQEQHPAALEAVPPYMCEPNISKLSQLPRQKEDDKESQKEEEGEEEEGKEG
jgi:hypothetical protein